MNTEAKKHHNPIGHNLTGGQITILVTYLLLVQGLRPLFLMTRYLDPLIYKILNATVVYPKRKLSGVSQEELTAGLCSMLQGSREAAWEVFSKLKLERTSIIKYTSAFLTEVEESGYKDAYLRALTDPSDQEALAVVKTVEKKMGCDRFMLWSVYQHVKVHTTVFFDFRGAIIEQYLRKAHKRAGVYYANRTRNINFKDLVQNVIASVTVNLDRYDSTKGALTSYLDLWMTNACAQSTHVDGLAYDVPNSVKVDMASGKSSHVNIGVSLSKPLTEDLCLEDTQVSDKPDPETERQQQEEELMLRKVIKCADTDGIFRLVNGIEEVFFPSELLVAQSQSIPMPEEQAVLT